MQSHVTDQHQADGLHDAQLGFIPSTKHRVRTTEGAIVALQLLHAGHQVDLFSLAERLQMAPAALKEQCRADGRLEVLPCGAIVRPELRSEPPSLLEGVCQVLNCDDSPMEKARAVVILMGYYLEHADEIPLELLAPLCRRYAAEIDEAASRQCGELIRKHPPRDAWLITWSIDGREQQLVKLRASDAEAVCRCLRKDGVDARVQHCELSPPEAVDQVDQVEGSAA